jgi:hypothetical protein
MITATNVPRLRPLGIGQLLDQAIRLYRRNFLKFVGIIAVVQIPLTLIQILVSLLTVGSAFAGTAQLLFDTGSWGGILGSLLVSVTSFILIQGVATAALTRAVSDHYLGESTSFLNAYRRVGRSWRRLLGALLLAWLYAIGLVIWLLVPCIGWFTGIGILLFVGFAVFPLIAPIVVLENQRTTDAIRRAWDLARRRFWWITGFVLVLFLFGQLVVSGPSYLISLALQFSADNLFEGAGSAMTQTVVQSLVNLVFSLIYLPLQLTSITLVYFDLRVRTEAFDLALQAESSLGREINLTELLAQAPPPEGRSLVTWAEMGYFAILSIGGGVLYGLLLLILGIMMGVAMAGSSF